MNKKLFTLLLMLGYFNISNTAVIDDSDSDSDSETYSDASADVTPDYSDNDLQEAYEAQSNVKAIVKNFGNYVMDSTVNAGKYLYNGVVDNGQYLKVAAQAKVYDLAEKAEELKAAPGKAIDQKMKDISKDINEKVVDPVFDRIKTQIIKAGYVSAGVVASVYLFRKALYYIDNNLLQPAIVERSSNIRYFDQLKQIFLKNYKPTPLIFSTEFLCQLNKIIDNTKNINKHIKSKNQNICYRNMLLFGPSGTGKSTYAENLALACDMAFVKINCLDFVNYSEVESIAMKNKFISWLSGSNKVLLFINNIDYLSNDKIKNYNRDSIVSIINFASKCKNQIMTIFGANSLDLNDFIIKTSDKIIEFGLPNLKSRFGILNLYKNAGMPIDLKTKKSKFNKLLTPELLEDIANKTERFSGLELKELLCEINANYDPIDSTVEDIQDILKYYIDKKSLKLRSL